MEAVTSTFMNEFCSNFSMFYMNVWTLLFRKIENQRKAGFRYRAEINRKYGFFRSDVKISAEKGAGWSVEFPVLNCHKIGPSDSVLTTGLISRPSLYFFSHTQ